jgi:hypothetical protein
MLATAREPLTKDPQLVASLLQSAMSGTSRQLLESGDPEKHFATLRDELICLATAYLQARVAHDSGRRSERREIPRRRGKTRRVSLGMTKKS